MATPRKVRRPEVDSAPGTRKRRPRKEGPSLFVHHHEIAHDMDVSTKNLLRWIDQGKFPLPHSIQGTFRLWLRADYNHRIGTGRWPSHMKIIAKQS